MSKIIPVDQLDAHAAADRFVESVVDRCDKRDAGYYPLWHGWALHDAFMAGIVWAKEREKNEADALPRL